MPEFEPNLLREWSGGRWQGPPPKTVRGFTYDSRRSAPGDLFVCLKTEQRDGHDFLPQAARAGAVAGLVSRYDPRVALPQLVVADPLAAFQEMATAHRRRFRGPVVGISGSCGKTSTKDLLSLLLGGAPSIQATEGNLNNLIGVPVTLLSLDPHVHKAAVIEAGINFPGEMRMLADMIRPTDAIITAVAAVHLERLESLAGVAREKAVLAQAVPPQGVAMFPADCLQYEPFQKLSALVVAPGEGTGNPAFRVEQEAAGTAVFITRDCCEVRFALRKISRGMASNAVLAIEMARAFGVPDTAIQLRLAEWAPARFRGQLVDHGKTRFYVDCYNANPAAMADALAFFEEIADEAMPRLYVIGCMGELGAESPEHHREVGSGIKLRPGDRALITGGDVEALRAGMLAAGNSPCQIGVFRHLEEIEETVARHDGFVFMKGSRVYGLEALLEKVRARKEVPC